MAQEQRRVGSWALDAQPIGSGSFAIVWRARHADTGQEAAVKEINLSKLNAKLRQSLESEVSILKRINHENIVKLHEVHEEADRLYLVMEYCAGGDLAHLLRRVKRVPEAAAQQLMRQLAAGLRQMWSHHLVHRDLKPQNLLLSAPSATATLKIADFGFARNLQPQGLAETLCGSPLYMAPEILHFHRYDAKADLWSTGAILFELVAGRPPFTGANQFQLLRNIERGDARLPEGLGAQLSPACRHLIHALLRRNPVERLSFEEFFRHPFVATADELAAGLPPRAPYCAAAAAASTVLSPPGVRRAAPDGQPTLLFSTSAPLAAPPSGRPRPPASAPQQVLGFAQAAAPPVGGVPGSPAAPGVVPPGGLSHQLRPRHSLDLGAAGPDQQQQQQQVAARQQRPQPVRGHRLGSIQRVQGFAPAAAPGQAQPAARPAQQQQQQQGPAVPPHTGARQTGRQQGGALLAAAASQHSEDEDYVLVDAALSAHTAAGRASAAPSPPASAQASLAGSRHGAGSGEDDVFGAAPGDASQLAAAAAPSWLGASRWRCLQRVAHILQAAAAVRLAAAAPEGLACAAALAPPPGARSLLRECLSLHLAALQLLEHAMEEHATSAAAVPAAVPELGGDDDAAAAAAMAAADAAELAAAGAQLRLEAAEGMQAAEAAAAALERAGREPSPTAVTPAAAAAAEADAALPDPWELLYSTALLWGRDAAVDELLGNQARSCRLYARAGAVLSFLCSQAAGLELEPPIELGPADRARLLKYAAATTARWAACAAAAGLPAPAAAGLT